MTDVLTTLEEKLEPLLFPKTEGDDKDPRVCPSCDDGRLSLKLGKFGAFLGCSNYPDCKYTRPIGTDTEAASDAEGGAGDFPRLLGTNPETQQEVMLKKGPYGIYVETPGDEGKPKRVSLPKGMDPENLNPRDSM